MQVTVILGILLGASAILGAMGLWTWLLSRQAERRYPPSGNRIEVAGVTVHYVKSAPPGSNSDSPTVVLLHGAFGALQDFSETIFDDLAQTHRTIALDRPGHGYSSRPRSPWVGTPMAQAEWLHAVLVRLQVQRAVLVGFSWGGSVALAHALSHPEETVAVVLVASPTHPWKDPIAAEYRIASWPIVGSLMVATTVAPLGRLLAARGVEKVFTPLPVHPAFAASPVLLSLRPACYAANAEDMRVLKESLRRMSSRYAELQMPLIMVHGTLDHTVGIRTHSERLLAQVPNSELIRIPNVGHPLLYTHPEKVMEGIRLALKRLAVEDD
jgi:pimeloyl-ACP methyl ester carboxylesterase